MTADNARDAADANGQYAASLRALQQAELQELKQQQSANTGTQRLKAMKDYGEALGEVADDLKAVNGLIDEIETDRALSGSDSIFSPAGAGRREAPAAGAAPAAAAGRQRVRPVVPAGHAGDPDEDPCPGRQLPSGHRQHAAPDVPDRPEPV